MSGKVRAILLLGVMYALGVLSGLAWRSYRNPHFFNLHSPYAERRLQKLKTELQLTPDQEKSLRDIFQKAHERAIEVNEEVSWDLDDIHRDSVSSIRRILTPDQMKRFERLHRRFHSVHRHFQDDELDESTEPAKARP